MCIRDSPTRVVLDMESKLDKSLKIFDNEAETIRITGEDVDYKSPLAIQICKFLYDKNINSIIIEGGAKTLQTFINEDLWDEARVFKGTAEFKDGIKAPKFSGQLISESRIGNDILEIYEKK